MYKQFLKIGNTLLNRNLIHHVSIQKNSINYCVKIVCLPPKSMYYERSDNDSYSIEIPFQSYDTARAEFEKIHIALDN